VLSTCAFAVPAAIVYKKYHSQKGAIIGLVAGVLAMAVCMILWNYIVTPLYMGVPRQVVVGMLVPVFLPFNLVKNFYF
jgi:riboflavin transporter FmnP